MQNIVISHPTGNANLKATAVALADAGILNQFYTTIAAYPGSFLYKLGGLRPLSEIRRRVYPSVLEPFTKSSPWYEAGRMLSGKMGLKKLTKHETGLFSVDSVYENLDRHIARKVKKRSDKSVDAVYSYEDGAINTFRLAKGLGITCLYDLPIGYWRAMHRLLNTEKDLHPEWAATLTGFNDSKEKLARKDEELRLADHIFVASSFTANTLKDFPGRLAPVSVIPYGFPDPVNNRVYKSFNSRPLKILFVGGLSQRKGIANLFEAVENFGKKVELTVVGNKAVQNCNVLDKALAKHTWIPSLPHAEILKLMQQQDVFIFPSLFEGFGLVITEAMSQGTPVITTERTAGPDIITDGENGWLTEAGNTEALKQAIEKILFKPAQLPQIGKAAIETARKRPWSIYGLELVRTIELIK